MNGVRIITIDGPSGSGKGTIAARLASALGWRLLDSGALYRLVGLAEVAAALDIRFEGQKIYLSDDDVTDLIRTETAGMAASRVAVVPQVRAALFDWQRSYARPPGLVADGRDMGTVVFPGAALKIFLTASPEERARRRYKQLMEKGFPANLAALVDEIRERDERDAQRTVAPLKPADYAVVIDSTALTIDEVISEVAAHAKAVWPDLVI